MEFGPTPNKGIQAVTVSVDPEGAYRHEIVSAFSHLGEVADVSEITLPLAYTNLSDLEADCAPATTAAIREVSYINIDRSVEKALGILGKHCSHCSLSAADELGYQIALPRMRRAKENLLHAKLNGIVANS